MTQASYRMGGWDVRGLALKERLDRGSIPVPFCGCWVWLWGLDSAGYGALAFGGLRDRAHRFSWRVFRGPIPHGLFVLHTCDNRLCINPEHLFLGTHADNMVDKQKKGRNVSPGLKGQINPMSKLTEADVLNIRSSNTCISELAKAFSVSKANISMIRSRKTWAHI